MAEGQKNSILPLLILFVGGVAVGANWPKIRKRIKPLLDSLGTKTAEVSNSVSKFIAEQKENFEDRMVASKMAKKAKPVKKAVKTK